MSGLALIEQCDCTRKLTHKTCRSCRKNRKQIRNLDSQKKRMEKVLEERKCSQCDDVIDPKKARNTCGARCYQRQLSLKRKNMKMSQGLVDSATTQSILADLNKL